MTAHHLRRDSLSGHLARATNGHLRKCGAPQLCNQCTPPLPDTFYITHAGLAAPLSALNGKHAVVWVTACNWFTPGQPDLEQMLVFWAGFGWMVTAIQGSTYPCWKNWRGQLGGCDVTGVFSEYSCTDGGCSGLCAGSAGATCEVSLT